MSSLQLYYPPFLAPQSLTPWINRLTDLSNSFKGNLVITGNAEWGVPRLLHHLAPAETTLVLPLGAQHLDQPQAQASTLLKALERHWGVLQHDPNLGLATGLELLSHQLEVHQPQTLLLTGAEFAPDLAVKLLELSGIHRAILWFSQPPREIPLPGPLTWITPDELQLTLQEASSLAQPLLAAQTAQTFHHMSQGALESFLALCQQHLEPSRPVAAIGGALPGVVETLLGRKDLMGALELTVRDYPHLTPLLLTRIERALRLQPHHATLYRLLQNLPPEIKQQGIILRWRLEAALELGLQDSLMDEASACLQNKPCPELRAAYAEALYHSNDLEGYAREAHLAAGQLRSPATLYHLGYSTDLINPTQGREILLQAIRLAEQSQDWYWAIRATQALSKHHCTQGQYRQAAHWAEWGIRVADHHQVEARQLRLWLLSEWAFNRLLSGETLGLEQQLRTASGTGDFRLDFYLGGTLGDVLLTEGRAEEAWEVYQTLWHKRQPAKMGAISNLAVQALLELKRYDEALQIAREAVDHSQGFHPVQQRRAKLALGMVMAFTDPTQAVPMLNQALQDLQKPLLAQRLVQAGLFLAHAYLQIGQPQTAKASLRFLKPHLEHLSQGGLRYLSGDPAIFRPVLELLPGQTLPRLELRFLGEPEVRLDGAPLRLGNRACELLAVLALHPDGLTAEALSRAIYGTHQESEIIPVLLSGLKQRNIPIHSRPYRLGLEVWADFVELPKLIKQNRLREALSLLRGGTLLEKSESPLLRAQRDHIYQMLHQAVVESNDLEAVLALAQHKPTDPALWNQAMNLMPLHDPRRVGIAVHHGQ